MDISEIIYKNIPIVNLASNKNLKRKSKKNYYDNDKGNTKFYSTIQCTIKICIMRKSINVLISIFTSKGQCKLQRHTDS